MMQVVIGKGMDGRELPEDYNASTSSQAKGPVEAIDMSNFRRRGASEWEMTFAELASGTQVDPNFKVDPYKMNTELSYRLVQMLFVLVLPFIAVLFVIEPRRNPGPMRFLAGLLTILGFHQFLGLAANFSREGTLPAWLTLWVPLLILVVVVFWRFHALSVKPGFNTAR
jgi:lipopolysaccharide export system permease protein